jgi:LysM repeat protein
MGFRSLLSLVTVAGSALVLSGCGGGGSGKHAPTGAASTVPAPAPSVAPTAPDPSVIDPAKRIVDHQVQAGESLWKIARDYKTTVKEIKAANQLAVDTIRAGQTLKVPASLAEGTSPGAPAEAAPAAPSSPQPAAQ